MNGSQNELRRAGYWERSGDSGVWRERAGSPPPVVHGAPSKGAEESDSDDRQSDGNGQGDTQVWDEEEEISDTDEYSDGYTFPGQACEDDDEGVAVIGFPVSLCESILRGDIEDRDILDLVRNAVATALKENCIQKD